MNSRTGRPTQLPPYYIKAVWYAIFAIVVAVCVWYVASRLTDLMILVAICFFLAFAIEPVVNRLAARGWGRARATLMIFVLALTLIITFLTVLGRMLVDEVVSLLSSAPALYEQLRSYLDSTFNLTIPEPDELMDQYLNDAQAVVADNALDIAAQFLMVVFGALTVLLVTFYLVVDGPRFRRAVCSVFPQDTQKDIVRGWEIAIDKTSSYLVSRTILAAISAVVTSIFLLIVQVPYALALGIFTGVVAQFVPTIGTYIAGLLPVLVALSSSLGQGIAVLIFVVAYQQVENLTLEPRISAHAMELNVAVSFLAVLAGVAVLGPVGALLALPFVATATAFVGAYINRHAVIETELTQVEES